MAASLPHNCPQEPDPKRRATWRAHKNNSHRREAFHARDICASISGAPPTKVRSSSACDFLRLVKMDSGRSRGQKWAFPDLMAASLFQAPPPTLCATLCEAPRHVTTPRVEDLNHAGVRIATQKLKDIAWEIGVLPERGGGNKLVTNHGAKPYYGEFPC